MYRIGNKILKRGSALYKAENQTVIDLKVRGTCFPDRSAAGTAFTFASLAGNKMNIDFADGTGVHTFLPNAGNNFETTGLDKLHYYQDLLDPSKIGTVDSTYPQERIIKIWFDYPTRISTVQVALINVYGEFPKNIGNYTLGTLRFSGNMYMTSFPIRFRGGIFNTVQLIGIATVKPITFPLWVGNSRIVNLTLANVLDLSAGSVATSIDTVSTCKDLQMLVLSNNALINNSCFPTTLKNISTLRSLSIGGNAFVNFPSRVGECAQIEKLVVSNSDGNGYAMAMTTWGTGIGLMTSLKELVYVYVGSTIGAGVELTTDLPLNLSNCILLKNVDFSITFRTLVRLDAHITNWYNFIIANASLAVGDTKFRNMTINVGRSIPASISLRPSGGATPTSVNYTLPTPIQMIYNLAKDYGHTWLIRNLADTDIETITP